MKRSKRPYAYKSKLINRNKFIIKLHIYLCVSPAEIWFNSQSGIIPFSSIFENYGLCVNIKQMYCNSIIRALNNAIILTAKCPLIIRDIRIAKQAISEKALVLTYAARANRDR